MSILSFQARGESQPTPEGPRLSMLVRSRHATGGERACCMTRPNNGSEGDNSECCTNAVYFAYNYLDNKDNRPQKTCD